MALTVQKYDGTVDGANSYGDVLGMRAHFTDRGVTLASSTDDQLSVGLILATEFLDGRYAFIGEQLRGLQGTACPRYLEGSGRAHSMRDVNLLAPAYLLTTRQWQVLVAQCYELARRALAGPLLPDPTRDASGLTVVEKKTVAGPIETSKKFGEAGGRGAEAVVPLYPSVDLSLKNAGLLVSRASGQLVRG
jgi:hypothetical protein